MAVEQATLLGDCIVRKSWDGSSWVGNNGTLKKGVSIMVDRALAHDGYTRTTAPIIGWIPSNLVSGVVVPPPPPPPTPTAIIIKKAVIYYEVNGAEQSTTLFPTT